MKYIHELITMLENKTLQPFANQHDTQKLIQQLKTLPVTKLPIVNPDVKFPILKEMKTFQENPNEFVKQKLNLIGDENPVVANFIYETSQNLMPEQSFSIALSMILVYYILKNQAEANALIS